MNGQAETIRPNLVAALPGRMLDEAPKNRRRDQGGRPPQFMPAFFGFIGMIIVDVLIVWFGIFTPVIKANGLAFDVGIAGIMLVMTAGAAIPFGGYIYRRSRPSASGLDPEGEGRTLH